MKISKKTVFIAIAALSPFILTGCNKQIIDFDYHFNKAICNIGGEYKEIQLRSWNDYEGEQLQLKDYQGHTYLVHSANCTLVDNN